MKSMIRDSTTVGSLAKLIPLVKSKRKKKEKKKEKRKKKKKKKKKKMKKKKSRTALLDNTEKAVWWKCG